MQKIKPFLLYFILPAVIYFAFFAFYTLPWIGQFSTHFFGDAGDGLQNAWNLWWINKTIGEGQNIWFTTYLHFPHGTTLFGHTLSPLNGLIGAVLLKFLSIVQAYNSIVTLAFIGTGLTTFWLCYNLSRSYIGSLLGGFAFTFSSYHFAHAIGHMNLITLQWVPLFLLAWWLFLKQPTYKYAAYTVLALLAVILSDFYYLLFSVIAAAIMLLYVLATKQFPHQEKQTWKSIGLLLLLSLLLLAPLPIAVIYANHTDPLLGAHDPIYYGTDLLSTVIPGQMWRFAELTKFYWEKNYLGIVEGSVSVSLVGILALLGVLFRAKKLPKDAMVWVWMALIFAALSIGPRLHYMGEIVADIPMPYSVAARLFPLFKLAGVPVRMMVMTMLASSVALSLILSKLHTKKPLHILAFTAIALFLFIEAWPTPLPSTRAITPKHIAFLRDLPDGSVYDTASSRTYALYFQTIHEKPIVGGYISRVPYSVDNKDAALTNSLNAQNFKELYDRWGVRYFLAPANYSSPNLSTPLFKDTEGAIYDLKY
jgi:hypothetical protein